MNAKMTQFMYDLNILLDKRYDIVLNDNADKWHGARILIHADFNCNKWLVTKRGFNRRGEPAEQGHYTECRECHCKHGCRISKEFADLIEKNDYRCDVIEGCTIGLWRK